MNTLKNKKKSNRYKEGNEELRQNLTKEMFEEVCVVFDTLADSRELMSLSKLPLALKALGMSISEVEDAGLKNTLFNSNSSTAGTNSSETINIDEPLVSGSGNNSSEYNSNNDAIDLDKFIDVVLICLRSPNWAGSEMMEVFSVFDRNGDGFIDSQELKKVFARYGEVLNENELDEQINDYDLDKDKKVNF